jgi:outer membrane lipoprotein carrier protein
MSAPLHPAPHATTQARSRRRLAAGVAVAVLLWQAPALAADALDQFLAGLSSWRAPFAQQVVDSAGKRIEQGAGTLLVSRPGRFRWQYTPQDSGAQLLISDGSNLWFYDQELQQATVKPASAALSTTPVVLLSGTAAQMHAAFDITPLPERAGMSWVQVVPRSASADFADAQLGFRGTQLRQLLIHDRLGQSVTLDFQRSERNVRIAESDLHFTPPAGVDVIGTAVPP